MSKRPILEMLAERPWAASPAAAGALSSRTGSAAAAFGAGSFSRSARLMSCGRSFSQRNSIRNRMTPSPVGLLDNWSRRSSSPLQVSSEASVAASDPADGRGGETTSLGIFVSGGARSDRCAAARGVTTRTSRSSSARADWAWSPSDGRSKRRHPSVDFYPLAIESPNPRRPCRGAGSIGETSACLAEAETWDDGARCHQPIGVRHVHEIPRHVRVDGRDRNVRQSIYFQVPTMPHLRSPANHGLAIGQFTSFPCSTV